MQQIKLSYLTDGHGDVREITDKAGNTLVKYSYNAFGSLSTTWTNPSSAFSSSALQLLASNPYRYASYRYDSDTGMYYLRARYYDPVTGRFLSKDPILKEQVSKEISDIGKANPFVKDIADELLAGLRKEKQYAYTANNPVNYVDVSGYGWWIPVYIAGMSAYVYSYPYVSRWAMNWRVPTIRLSSSLYKRKVYRPIYRWAYRNWRR